MGEVEQVIIDTIVRIANDAGVTFDGGDKSALLGKEGVVDSMGLVEVCIVLEDLAAEFDFEFDWTSEKAMSTSKSMYRTVQTLANEFNDQRTAQT